MREVLYAALIGLAAFFAAPMSSAAQPASAPAPAVFGDHAHSIAVVIGNRNYQHGAPAVEFAHDDANAIREWLIAIGFRPQNILLRTDLTRAGFDDIFGVEGQPVPGRLHTLAQPGRSHVFVFYSGHGVPDPNTGRSFLLPVDVDPERVHLAVPVEQVYAQLAAVQARIGPSRRVVVVFDACFTGQSHAGPLQRNSNANFVPRPLPAAAEMLRITASRANQVAHWDSDNRLSLLTARFLMAVNGIGIDAGRGQIAWRDLGTFLAAEVNLSAQRLVGRAQEPETSEGDLLLPVTRTRAMDRVRARADDEAAYAAAEQADTAEAYEIYVQNCTLPSARCAYVAEAERRARERRDARDRARDQALWRELSPLGRYAEYLQRCRPTCAFASIARERLGTPAPPAERPPREPPRGPAPVQTAPPAPVITAQGRIDCANRGAPLTEDEARLVRSVTTRQHLDDPRTRELVARAACHSAADAMAWVGSMYANARGVPQDDAEAVRWFRSAIQAGSANGLTRLGVMFAEGRGVPQDFAEAARHYRMAAERGDVSGMAQLGLSLATGRPPPRDEAAAIVWYRRAADQGDLDAMNNLGWLLTSGRDTPRDDLAAFRLFERAGERGHMLAQYRAGWMLGSGRGIARNHAAARVWFRRAADQGHGGAHIDLARLLEQGLGGPRDRAGAIRLYRRVAEVGDPQSQRQAREALRRLDAE